MTSKTAMPMTPTMTTTREHPSTDPAVNPVDLASYWSACNRRVNAELERRFDTQHGAPERLLAAMRHAVLGVGKRLRPLLVLATHDSLNGSHPGVDAVAAAVEMIHSYSLVHDDLPCMDDDDQRRGRPTVHVAFDEATAVLAGDALHALAFEVLSRHAPAEVVAVIANAVGPTGMVGGQLADLQAEGQSPTESLVREVHRRKTGALIQACVRAGAALADADETASAALTRYALPLGLAFQIVDDILELTESSESLGKPTGSDLKHRKVTYPAAVGLQAARDTAMRLTADAKAAVSGYPGDASILLGIADYVVHRTR